LQPELEELTKRLDKLEKQKNQEILALVEILSNATFFGDLKKIHCQYAKDGQCSYFVLETNSKSKMPIVTDCKIEDCQVPSKHCHIELSNITCTFCQATKMESDGSYDYVKKKKTGTQNKETSLSDSNTAKSRSKEYVK
jgi:hypothetical protein